MPIKYVESLWFQIISPIVLAMANGNAFRVDLFNRFDSAVPRSFLLIGSEIALDLTHAGWRWYMPYG